MTASPKASYSGILLCSILPMTPYLVLLGPPNYTLFFQSGGRSANCYFPTCMWRLGKFKQNN